MESGSQKKRDFESLRLLSFPDVIAPPCPRGPMIPQRPPCHWGLAACRPLVRGDGGPSALIEALEDLINCRRGVRIVVEVFMCQME
ncbi:MAG: hypothetical protein CM1200mP29_04850 [Verrucomicrobiota bacterium]|nr:MAG: hypothetical protein CM1200mP29_04850 [Verrucomicrobiota bacterium]